MGQAVARCTEAVEHREQLSIGVVNAAKIVTMRRDAQLREAVAGCGMVLADGQSVVWASRVLRCAAAGTGGRRSTCSWSCSPRPPGAVTACTSSGHGRTCWRGCWTEVGRRFPGLIVAGARDGYYQPGDEAEVAEEIRSSPRGHAVPRHVLAPQGAVPGRVGHGDEGARVVHGVGGSFDILAGLTRRAPLWYQRHGLEWLYRAWQEPLRLGRRYLKTNMAFLALVARERIRRRGAPGPDGPAAGRPGCTADPAGTAAPAPPPAPQRRESAHDQGRRGRPGLRRDCRWPCARPTSATASSATTSTPAG